MKISNSKSRTPFLEEFDTILQKFDIVSDDKMPASQKISLLKEAVNADIQLLQACTAVETIISNTKLNTTTSYEEYLDYFVSHSEKIEESGADKSGRRANVAETNFMESFVLDDTHYKEATDIAIYMGEQDVDMIHSMLEYNQALRDEKLRL